MSLLPALFRRTERMQPLGTTRAAQPAEKAAAAPVNDWSFATKRDCAPKRVRLHLTDAAEAESADFHAHYDSCSCHISPPCSSCTHPGNPLNLEEDHQAWVYGFAEEGGAA